MSEIDFVMHAQTKLACLQARIQTELSTDPEQEISAFIKELKDRASVWKASSLTPDELVKRIRNGIILHMDLWKMDMNNPSIGTGDVQKKKEFYDKAISAYQKIYDHTGW